MPYSADDHSPRGYVDVSRKSLSPTTQPLALAGQVLPARKYAMWFVRAINLYELRGQANRPATSPGAGG